MQKWWIFLSGTALGIFLLGTMPLIFAEGRAKDYLLDLIKKDVTSVGQVIFWFRPNKDCPIPHGYQVCDGKPITEGKYVNINTPNLLNKFVMGVLEDKEMNKSGGKNTISIGTDQRGEHRHVTPIGLNNHGNAKGWSGIVAKSDSGPPATPNGSGHWKNAPYHYYNFSGLATAHETVYSFSGVKTAPDGKHGHEIEFDNRPSYVGLLPLIKIK